MYLFIQLLGQILEFIAFILVIYKYRLLYRTSLRLLLLVIPFIFITEFFAFIQIRCLHGMTQNGNINYYNITTLVTSLLYFGLYLENIHSPRTKKIFLAVSIFAFIFYLINNAFIQTGNTLHTYSYTICSLCLCLGIIFYIKEIVETEKIVYISKDPLFWISIGLFAFNIINIPYMGMYNYLLENFFDSLSMLLNVSVGLNIFMYCCIIIGLLCLRN